jgi:hypothetical protein
MKESKYTASVKQKSCLMNLKEGKRGRVKYVVLGCIHEHRKIREGKKG